MSEVSPASPAAIIPAKFYKTPCSFIFSETNYDKIIILSVKNSEAYFLDLLLLSLRETIISGKKF